MSAASSMENVCKMDATFGHGRGESEPRPLTSDPPRTNAAIARTVFTTQGLPSGKQFDAYREYCAPVIEVSPNERFGSGFDAFCEMWQLGGVVCRRIRTPAGSFGRSNAQLRRDGLDHWVFNVVRLGKQNASAAGSEISTDAGELSVFSLAGAYQAHRTNIDWVGLFVPRGTFPAIDAALNHNEHRVLDNTLGHLLAGYLVSLTDQLPFMKEHDVPHANQALQALVQGSVASSSSVVNSSDPSLDMPRMRLLRDIIDENLGSWNLHAGRLCKLAEVSRSNLYRMFEPYGGVVRYIQRQRLRRAHEQLADPRCTRQVSLIAHDHCFADSSTFSRAFRHEFGYSPTDLRRRVEGGSVGARSGRLSQAARTGGSWDFLFGSWPRREL